MNIRPRTCGNVAVFVVLRSTSHSHGTNAAWIGSVCRAGETERQSGSHGSEEKQWQHALAMRPWRLHSRCCCLKNALLFLQVLSFNWC